MIFGLKDFFEQLVEGVAEVTESVQELREEVEEDVDTGSIGDSGNSGDNGNDQGNSSSGQSDNEDSSLADDATNSIKEGFIEQIKEKLPKAKDAFKNTMEGMQVDGANTFRSLIGGSQAFITTLWDGLSPMSKFSIGIGAIVVAAYGLHAAYEALTYTTEELKNKTDALMDSYNDTLSKAKSNAKRIEEIADRYETLSKGVGECSENISLSNDSYEEYISLTSEIADMFPDLVQGYNSEGVAILNLKDNVDSLRDAYKEAQEEAYNMLIVSGEDYDGNDIIKEWTNLNNTELLESLFDLGAADIDGQISAADALKQLEEVASMSFEDFKNIKETMSIGSMESIKALSDIEKEVGSSSYLKKALGLNANISEDDFKIAKQQAQLLAQTYETEINISLSKVRTLANAFLMKNEDYKMLDEESQKVASTIVNTLDKDIANQFKNKDEVGLWVQNLANDFTILKNEHKLASFLDLFDTSVSPEEKIAIATELQAVFKDLKIDIPLDFILDENDEDSAANLMARVNAKTKELMASVDNEDAIKKLEEAKENLENEYQKIQDWGLENYEKQIKNGTSQFIFGNINMDKRAIITWSEELKQTYKDALSSWDYDPEIGSIDTVFGGSSRFGENLNGIGWEVAFTPILPDGTFLSADTVYDYIETILAEAYANDGKVTEDELTAIDTQGRQIGNVFVQGIFAGVDESLNYENNGNWAEVIGRLMHFSGIFGAVNIAKQRVTDTENDVVDIEKFKKEQGIDTDAEEEEWLKVTEGITDAIEAMNAWIEYKKVANTQGNTSIFGSETNIKAIDAFQEKAESLSSTLEKIKSGEFSDNDLVDLLSEFPELEEKTDNLELAIIELIQKALQELYSILGEEVPDNVKEMLDGIAASATGAKEALNKAFSDIQSSYDIMKEFKEAMADGMTDSALSGVAGLSGELHDLVAEYYAGLVSQEDIYAELQKHYQNDLKNYGNALIAKNELNADFYNAVGLNNTEFINHMFDNYGVDISNCKNYAEAKLKIEQQLLRNVSAMWSKYYNAQSQTFNSEWTTLNKEINRLQSNKNFADTLGVDFFPGIGGNIATSFTAVDQANLNTLIAIRDSVAKHTQNYESAIDALNSVVYKGIDADFINISNKLDKNADSSDKDTTETFDWIERLITNIQRVITNLGKTVDATYEDWADRNTALLDQMSMIKAEIEVQQNAYSAYMKKANSVGLSDYYKGLVQSGDYSIQDITDEKLQEKIKKYQDYYDKAISAQDTIADLEADLANLTMQKFDNLANQYENRLNDIEHRTNTINNLLDNATSSEKDGHYDNLIGLEKESISVLKEQYAALGEELRNALSGGNIEEGSEDWQKMTDQITEIEASIQESTNNLYDLAKQKFDNIVNDFENKLSAIENEVNIINTLLEQSTTSEKDKHYSSLIELEKESLILLQEQYTELNKELQEAIDSGVAINSDAWIEMNEQITSVNQSILETKNNLADLAKQKFDNVIDEYDSKLNGIAHETTTTENTMETAKVDDKDFYYNKLLALEESNVSVLKQKYKDLQTELQNALDNGYIEKYSDAWKEMNETIRDTKENLQESQNNLSNLATQRFDSIAQEYENQLDAIERKAESINNDLEKATASEKDKHYVSLMYLEKQSAVTLQKEYDALQKSLQDALDAGYIKKYSDAWYELTNKIKDTEQAIQDSDLALTDLLKQRFDNITAKYEDAFNKNSHKTNTINTSLEVAVSGEKSGLYGNLIDLEEENISILKKKYNELQQALKFALDNGYVREYDDVWREMNGTITEVEETIQESMNNLSDLTLQKFNSVAEDFSNKMNAIKNQVDVLNSSLEQATNEQKDSLYKGLIGLEQENISILKSEYEELRKLLQEALDKGYVKEYDDAWLEMTEQINNASQAIQDCENNVSDLAVQIFENLASGFEKELDAIERRANKINNLLENATLGEKDNHYDSLIGLEKKDISILKEEYESLKQSLQESLDTGYITEYSDAWYEMMNQILDIEEAIQDAENNIVDLTMQKFDNLLNKYEVKLNTIEHETNTINNLLESTTSIGKDGYYSDLIGLEKNNISILKKEYADLYEFLQNELKNGNITKYDDNWYKITDELNRIKETIQEITNSISDLAKQKFDNIADAFENRLSDIEHRANMINSFMENATASGKNAYYDYLVDLEKDNIALLEKEYADLQKSLEASLKNGHIKEYSDEWHEMNDQIDSVRESIQESINSIADLAMQKFDNIAKDFENKINLIKHEAGILDNYIAQTEAKGHLVSTKYYERLIAIEKSNLKQLEAEYKSLKSTLQEALDNGTIKMFNDDWYEMTNQIFDVENAIQEANTSILEFMNNIRELEWEVFDKTQDMISQIQSESDFIIDLMGDEKMFDDNGQWTEHANATAGLHAVNYNAYMSQADDYAKEIEKINKDLAKDPYNLTLIERRNELLELQRDMIQSAEDEKQAIKDLVSDGYDAMLKALQEIIDKRKEALQAEKDLYDYEKQIREQTKNIASLEKQAISMSGDDSEESLAKVQQIKVQLEEAKADLEETEYDKWLSDQQQMLDNLLNETELWINQRLDDLDAVIREVIDATNLNADAIKQTIDATTQAVGYSLTEKMESIWNTGAELKDIVSIYDANFNLAATTTNTAIAAIQELVQTMIAKSDEQAQVNIKNQEDQGLRDENQLSILMQLYEQGKITGEELLQALNQLYLQGDITTEQLLQAEALVQEQNRLKAEEQIQKLEQLKEQEKILADELLETEWQTQEQDKNIADEEIGKLDEIKDQDKEISDEEKEALDEIKDQDKELFEKEEETLEQFKEQEQLLFEELLKFLNELKEQERLGFEKLLNFLDLLKENDNFSLEELLNSLELLKEQEYFIFESLTSSLEQHKEQNRLGFEGLFDIVKQFKEQEKLTSDNELNAFEEFKGQEYEKVNGILSVMEQIKGVIQTISNMVGGISEKVSNNNNTPSNNTPSSNPGSSNTGENNNNTNNNSSWGSWFIYKKNRYPVNKLDIEKSIVDN